MANKKISELSQISNINRNTFPIPIADLTADETKYITPNQLTTAIQKTGSEVSFIEDAVYGTTGGPESGSEITVDLTGAQLGVTVLILHQSNPAPTISSEFVLISGIYDPTKINRILCTYIDDLTIDYSISQPV